MAEPALIVIDRSGGFDFDRIASQAGAGATTEVLRVHAPWRAVDLPGKGVDLALPARLPLVEVVARALAACHAERVVIVDGNAVADATGVLALAARLDDAAVVAPRLVRRDGRVVEWDRGSFSLGRYAYSPRAGYSIAGLARDPLPSLWFDRRAFAARRQTVLDARPTGTWLTDALAPVAWGWRLWLLGERVLTASDVALRIDETILPVRELAPAPSTLAALRHRSAFGLLATALETPTLIEALALLGRSGEQEPGQPASQRRHDPRAGHHLDERDARARLGSSWPINDLDALLHERDALQMRRTISDHELFELTGDIFEEDRRHVAPSFVQRLTHPARARTTAVVLCSDVLGTKIAGPAIRALEMARTLAADGNVELGVREVIGTHDAPCPVFPMSDDTVDQALERARAVVVQGPLTEWFPQITASRVPLVVDLYDPMNLEALESADPDLLVPYTTNVLFDQLLRGDFFVCASERQRDYWLGMLAAAGRLTPAAYRRDPDVRSLIDVAPFGIPAEAPVRTGPGVRGVVDGIGEDDPLIVWNGGIWEWFDTDTFVRAIDVLRRDIPNVRAFFMGVRPPGEIIPSRAASLDSLLALAESLGLLGTHVFYRDWTPYDERQNTYLDATALVSLHHAHLETRFSFRTRLLDAIWASVPIVCTRGDVLAGLVEDEQLGATAAPGDVEGVALALKRVLSDAALQARARSGLAGLAPRFHWDHALEPVRAFAREPSRAPGRPMTIGGLAVARQLREAPERPPIDIREPSSLKYLVPLSLRLHVLGPAKRRVQRTLRGS